MIGRSEKNWIALWKDFGYKKPNLAEQMKEDFADWPNDRLDQKQKEKVFGLLRKKAGWKGKRAV